MNSLPQQQISARYGRWGKILFLVLLAPCLLLLTPDMVWDDKLILGWHARMDTTALFGILSLSWIYWRPLGVLSIVLPHLMGMPLELNKALSLLLFAAIGWILISFHVRTALGSIKASVLLLAAFLALSPVFAETIVWLSARFDLLLTLFVAGLLLRHATLVRQPASDQSNKRYLAEGLVWGLVLGLTKESGSAWALGIAAILVLDGLRCNRNPQLIRLAIGLIAGTAVTLVLRSIAFAVFDHPVTPMEPSHAAYFPFFAEAMTREMVMFAAPFLDRAPTHPPGWGIPVLVYILSVVLPLLTGIGALLSARAFHKQSSFFWMWAWAALAGAALIGHAALTPLHDVTSLGQLICERYIAPSAAVLIALAMTALSGLQGKARIAALCLALYAVCATLPYSFDDKIAWSSRLDLWTRTWEHGTHFTVAAISLVDAKIKAGKTDEAQSLSRSWLETHPNNGKDNCLFVNTLVYYQGITKETSVALKNFIPYAWCSPFLALKAVELVEADRSLCPSLLRMTHRADEEWKGQGSLADVATQARAEADSRCGYHETGS